MGEKIGLPLVVETAKPRIHPKELPEPQPETVPEEEPEKEKITATDLLQDVETLLKGNMTSVSVAEQVYMAFEAGLPKVAKFLGVAEQQIIDDVVTLAARAHDMLRYLRAVKGSTISKAI